MATRSPRDKPQNVTSPKITPRPTAASAARASRNTAGPGATPPPKAVPSRAPSSPNALKTKTTLGQRHTYKAEIKTEGKDLHKTELESLNADKIWESNMIITNSTSEENKMNADISVQEIHIEKKAEPTHRPRTPISETQTVKSRPQTPRTPSRPATPSHPAAQRMNADSRPATARSRLRTPGDAQPAGAAAAQQLVPSRSPAHTDPPQDALGDSTTVILEADSESLRSMFNSRKNQFNQMKKELDIKQQSVLKAFDQLRSLHDRISQDGATDPGLIPQDLVVLNVTDWAAGEIAQWYRGSNGTEEVEELLNNPQPLDENIVKDVSARITEIPASFADLCLRAFTARQDIIDWVKELVTGTENGSGEALDKIAKLNTQGLDLCEALRDMKGRADGVVTTVIELSK
ncbi:hypothetical protein EVAR_8153_1 [Eumeta japonica]|uniref:Uncharacterized protein n=1 Tax=Eumeta variegata TaxID=151549 RepID=A0A4C1TSV1_EUMVA|nr:hypothetical protein EVAR_8153_1 [Eumeta japonica]